MTGSSKIITAQVGAKLVTIELGSPDKHGARKLSADMFGAVGCIKNQGKGYFLSVDLREIDQAVFVTGSTIPQCTDKFFSELRYFYSVIEARKINTAEPPADLFEDEQSQDDYDLERHEADKANW
jgi:hypothetical protein